jgi:hypothetical protein
LAAKTLLLLRARSRLLLTHRPQNQKKPRLQKHPNLLQPNRNNRQPHLTKTLPPTA